MIVEQQQNQKPKPKQRSNILLFSQSSSSSSSRKNIFIHGSSMMLLIFLSHLLLLLFSLQQLSSSSSTTHAFMIQQQPQQSSTRSINRSSSSNGRLLIQQLHASSTRTTTRSNTIPDTTKTTPKKKVRSIQDRTPEDAIQLLQEIIQLILDSGLQSGPQRTIQALRAVTETNQQYVPELLELSRKSILSTSSGSSNNNNNNITDEITKQLLPKMIRTLFEKMGATYIKLGQFIASSPTIFPIEYVTEFQKCLDQTTPLPWETIEKILQTEYQTNNLNTIFHTIDTKPLASASIAQVHRATLLRSPMNNINEEVVLKIQKPNIGTYLQTDLTFLYITAKLLEFIQPDWERTSLSAVVSDIRMSMLHELDFTKECSNTIEFRTFLQQQQLMNIATCPKVYETYTTKKVLVLEYLDGISLLDEKTIQSIMMDSTTTTSSSTTTNNNENDTTNSSRGTEVILNALNIWSLSITSMPWFHADLHAGNLLLLRDGRLGFIDFGIVGRISPSVLLAVTDLSTALAFQDYIGMANALCSMGATEENINIPKFANDLQRVITKMNMVQVDVNAILSVDTTSGKVNMNANTMIDETDVTNLLFDFIQVTEENGLKLPREFGLLVKQMLYFDRYTKILAPTVNIMNDSRIITRTTK